MSGTIKELYTKELSDFNTKFKNPKFYINRELSWVEFNKRVLHQTLRKELPLLERLKFLGISASNLDEFIMVRFASVLHKVLNDISQPDLSGLLPPQEYRAIYDKIFEFKKVQQECYARLVKKLIKNNIRICRFNELSHREKQYVDRLFQRNIYPLLTPMTYDTTKEFPLIKSKQFNIIVSLEDKTNPNLNVLSIIPIDSCLERVYKIESDDTDESKYIMLEDIIFAFLSRIFINKTILYRGSMRILREADIELEHNEDVYIIDRMKQTLIARENSDPIFMDISANVPKHILKLLIKVFGMDKHNVYKNEGFIDLSVFAGMPIKDSYLEYQSFTPQYPQELIGEHDMFTAIDNNDILLHHPYESYGPVIKFLEHASEDRDVLVIKQTLYRVSSADSPIVEALCRAAENGKQVSVLLEIKARFDENRNISLIDKLRLSGCKIIYGVEELKTHCKFILIVRRTKKGLKTYCHLGTGNYNDKTAKVYTDLSYFTSKDKIGEDLITVFNILSGFSDPTTQINKLFFSPYNLRSQLYMLIDREIDNVRKGKKGLITLKLNSISDKGIIMKLYQASERGVKINIICRGVCSMKPINKNISIRSVIGRYLEHSRVYYFFNNEKSEVYISSADMLSRNLDRRVELLIPITDSEVRGKLYRIILSFYKDTFNTYLMTKDGEYRLFETDVKFNVHEYFMNEAIQNYKLRSIPKITFKNKKK